MGQFKEYLLQEGELWDALTHGFTSGCKAFQKKREEQKTVTQKQRLTDKVLDVKSKSDLEGLVKQIVANGYSIQDGEVKEKPRIRKANTWLTENAKERTSVQSQERCQFSQDQSQ